MLSFLWLVLTGTWGGGGMPNPLWLRTWIYSCPCNEIGAGVSGGDPRELRLKMWNWFPWNISRPPDFLSGHPVWGPKMWLDTPKTGLMPFLGGSEHKSGVKGWWEYDSYAMTVSRLVLTDHTGLRLCRERGTANCYINFLLTYKCYSIYFSKI